ncbi:MAG: hypothetical protein ACKN9P_15990, partial [Phenylobacterium sp.]
MLLKRAQDLMVTDPNGSLTLVDEVLRGRKPNSEADKIYIEACWLKAQALNRLGRQSEALAVVEPAIVAASKIAPDSGIMGELKYTRA